MEEETETQETTDSPSIEREVQALMRMSERELMGTLGAKQNPKEYPETEEPGKSIFSKKDLKKYELMKKMIKKGIHPTQFSDSFIFHTNIPSDKRLYNFYNKLRDIILKNDNCKSRTELSKKIHLSYNRLCISYQYFAKISTLYKVKEHIYKNMDWLKERLKKSRIINPKDIILLKGPEQFVREE